MIVHLKVRFLDGGYYESEIYGVDIFFLRTPKQSSVSDVV